VEQHSNNSKFQASVMLLGVPLYIMKSRVKYPLEVIINI